MTKRKLTARQQKFIQEYMIDLNATQAAIRAGYSERTAAAMGAENLRKPYLREAIEKLQAELAEETGITQRRVLNELALLGFSNMEDFTRTTDEGEIYTDFSDLSRDQMAAVQEVIVESIPQRGEAGQQRPPDIKKVKFKLADKKASLEAMGRHLGMFTDKHEITGKDGAALIPVLNVTRGKS